MSLVPEYLLVSRRSLVEGEDVLLAVVEQLLPGVPVQLVQAGVGAGGEGGDVVREHDWTPQLR